MAERIIVFWRDIPAQVIVKAGRKAERRELPDVFMQAVDQAAMVSGAKDDEAYLAAWRRSAPEPASDDLAAEADAAVAKLVAAYDRARLAKLAKAGGREEA